MRRAWDPTVLSVPDVTERALELFVSCQSEALSARGRFDVVISGGSTPLPLYHRLAREPNLPWPFTHVYWADERFVPPDDERSNARAAKEAFLDSLPIPDANLVPWPILATPQASAMRYAEQLEERLGPAPSFDLTLLGLGGDGHTASLFPGTGAVNAEGLTLALAPTSQPEPRLSLTAACLSRSKVVAFLVAGEDKRAALLGSLGNEGYSDGYSDGDPGRDSTGGLDEHPARGISAVERLLVITDLDLGKPRT